MSDATASKMEKTTASAGKLYRECPSSEKGAIYLSGTNVNGYFVEVAAGVPPTNVSALTGKLTEAIEDAIGVIVESALNDVTVGRAIQTAPIRKAIKSAISAATPSGGGKSK